MFTRRQWLTQVLVLMVALCQMAWAQSPSNARPIANQSDRVTLNEMILGPYVQYLTPKTARIHWRTAQPCASVLEYGPAGAGAKHAPDITLTRPFWGRLEQRVAHTRPKKNHAVTITGLLPDTVYAYRVADVARAGEQTTTVYALDTALNYSVQPLPGQGDLYKSSVQHARTKAWAQRVMTQTGVTKGYCLVWGIEDGQLAYELAANSQLMVIGIDDDPARIAAVRKTLYEGGVYGSRIVLHSVASLAEVPFPSHFANLIVSETALVKGTCPGEAAELIRVLQPAYGTAMLSCPDTTAAVEQWLGSAARYGKMEGGGPGACWVIKKPPLAETGSWTHQYGDAGNTSNSHDSMGGASNANQLEVQWFGDPGADFGIDRNPRMPAPLAVSGRLFHQGMNRMVALDSFNGAVLWSLEIPDLRRVNLPRDAGNWCSDASSLYVAIKDRCWVLDHLTGDLKHIYTLPTEKGDAGYEWGYVAHAGGVLLGSQVKPGTIYTDFWGNQSWYDKQNGPGEEKVCSDALFGYDLVSGSVLWQYRRGIVMNTTLAAETDSLYFVESRNPVLQQQSKRRLNDPALWSDQYLVSLNLRSGDTQWEVPLDTVDGTVVFFLSCMDETVIIASSAQGQYHLYAYAADTGILTWENQHKWPSDNHSGHMQHPVVFADKVFLEPCGYDLATGERFTSAVGRHEGCATYSGTKNALLYRGQSRRTALWDMDTGAVSSWYNLRPSCWLSTIAADGMMILPEGGGGCSCGNWLETSLVLSPISTEEVVR
jgi:outer membrane protein assembly factor BamB